MLALKCLMIEIASVGEVASARVCTHVNVYAITTTKTPSDVIVSPVGFVPLDFIYPVHCFFKKKDAFFDELYLIQKNCNSV